MLICNILGIQEHRIVHDEFISAVVALTNDHGYSNLNNIVSKGDNQSKISLGWVLIGSTHASAIPSNQEFGCQLKSQICKWVSVTHISVKLHFTWLSAQTNHSSK